VDIIVAQGWEAGGHVWGCVATLPLVPAVVDAVAPIPVIAAGGIAGRPSPRLPRLNGRRWEGAGRPAPGSRPGEGDVIAHFASGDPILRYSPAPPMVATTGEMEALSPWAGQSVALAKQPQPAPEIAAELALVAPIQVEVSPRQSSRATDTSAMADASRDLGAVSAHRGT
jgi:hypothetical protein